MSVNWDQYIAGSEIYMDYLIWEEYTKCVGSIHTHYIHGFMVGDGDFKDVGVAMDYGSDIQNINH